MDTEGGRRAGDGAERAREALAEGGGIWERRGLVVLEEGGERFGFGEGGEDEEQIGGNEGSGVVLAVPGVMADEVIDGGGEVGGCGEVVGGERSEVGEGGEGLGEEVEGGRREVEGEGGVGIGEKRVEFVGGDGGEEEFEGEESGRS